MVALNVCAGLAYLAVGGFVALKLAPLGLDHGQTWLILTSTLNPGLKIATLVLTGVLGVVLLAMGVAAVRWRRSARTLGFNLAAAASAALFLLVLEGAARYSVARGVAPLNAPPLYANGYCDEAYWKLLLRARGAPALPEEVYHPTLGWTPPRTEENPAGLAHGGPVGEGLGIPFYGDSFMEGATDPEETVPAHVVSGVEGVRADNLGVGGYGVGQITLRYHLTAERYADRPAVVGIMTENLDRTPLRVFSALKPAITLTDEGDPERVHVPVPRDPDAWLERNPIEIRSYAAAALGRTLEIVTDMFDGSNSECMREEKEAVNLFALDAARARKKELDQPWVGVIFASPRALARPDGWRRAFLRDYFEIHEIPYVDAVEEISRHADATGSSIDAYFLPDGHPNARGNELIGKAVAAVLRPMVDEARAADPSTSRGER